MWPTLQGEGPFAGTHAIFIRLAGCNLQCPFCDTEYSTVSKRYSLSLEDTGTPNLLTLLEDVSRLRPIRNHRTIWQKQLVVITGGEPFRQPLTKVVNALIEVGYVVQVETNGTIYQPVHRDAVIVCSPKTPRIDSSMAQRINAYKYVLDAGHVSPEDGLPSGTLGKYGTTARPPEGWQGDIFVQPLDEGEDETVLNIRNLQACVDACMRHGYRLCLQVHKIANLP